MKLKISNIDLGLNKETFVTNISNTLDFSKNMTFLDVSWVGLSPLDLKNLSSALSKFGWVIRNLNLGYNKL